MSATLVIPYDPGKHTVLVHKWSKTKQRVVEARTVVHPGLPTANEHTHWRTRAQVTKTIRTLTATVARLKKLPQFRSAKATVVLYYTRGNSRDGADNLTSGLKPVWDGLRDAGVLTGDTARQLRLEPITPECIRVDKSNPRIEITLTELES